MPVHAVSFLREKVGKSREQAAFSGDGALSALGAWPGWYGGSHPAAALRCQAACKPQRGQHTLTPCFKSAEAPLFVRVFSFRCTLSFQGGKPGKVPLIKLQNWMNWLLGFILFCWFFKKKKRDPI